MGAWQGHIGVERGNLLEQRPVDGRRSDLITFSEDCADGDTLDWAKGDLLALNSVADLPVRVPSLELLVRPDLVRLFQTSDGRGLVEESVVSSVNTLLLK